MEGFFGLSFVASSIMHYSNIVLCLLVFLISLLFSLKNKIDRKSVVIFLVPLLVMPLMHLAGWKKFTITNSAYFFLFSRLTALHISQPYLEEKCQTENLKLCAVWIDGFDPWLWSSHRSVMGSGGLEKFDDELKKVSIDILKKPSLALSFARQSMGNVLFQFFSFSRPLDPALNDQAVETSLSSFNFFEFSLYQKQRLKRLEQDHLFESIVILGNFYLLSFIISLFLLLLIFKRMTLIERKFIFLLFGFLGLNSLICGGLTEPFDRYQGRLAFLVPIFVFYILLDRIQPSEITS